MCVMHTIPVIIIQVNEQNASCKVEMRIKIK